MAAGLRLPDESIYLEEYRQLRTRVAELKGAWETFQRTGEVPEGVVKPEVLASWRRCRARGLDPYGNPNVIFLSSADLERRREANRLLIEVAAPFLETLAQSVRGSGFRIDLLDKDLYILVQYGDDKALAEGAALGSGPGVNRGEVNAGTNAINLAAHLRKPVQLVGPEHYNATLHYWTCSAVPVFSPRKDLLGVINIAGHFSLLHKHTLGMAIAVGRVIEQSLQQRELIAALELSNEYLNNVIHAVSDGLIVVDPSGVITTLNQAVGNFLNVEPAEFLGRRIEELLGPDNVFREVLQTGRPLVNREVVLRNKGRQHFFIGTLEPVRGREGSGGVIGVLKPLASAKRFVKNVAGFKAHFTFDDLVGQNPEFKRAVQLARQAAELPTTVLLQGESGTGKELFAQAIHNASPFRDGPFVAVNCAALPAELIESELFGYEGGAFTGARKEGRPGKFELAEGGTIFLDEISSMSLNMQAKLLRVLQTRTVVRLGGTTELPVRARLICATNRDLWQQVKDGTFREDLFYRINVLAITIPPLRERADDVPLLARYFYGKIGRRLGVECEVEDRVYGILAGYHWPGNVRELENAVERSLVLALSRGSRRVEAEDVLSYPGLRATSRPTAFGIPGYDLGEVELAAIRRALAASGGNISRAARLLGVARTTLYRKLRLYGLNCVKTKHM